MGGKNTSTTTSTSLPPQLAQAYQALIGYGSNVANLPLQQYTGPQTAGFTPDQTNAFNLFEQEPGIGIPYLNQASSWYGNAAQPIYGSLPTYSAASLQPYQNPYNQSVVNSTLATIQQADAEAQNQLRGQGILAGASPYYGDRSGVAAAQLATGQAQARDQTIANLMSQGFNNAQSQFLNQQQLQANTMGSDANRYLSSASGIANLGQLAQGQLQQGANAMLQGGNQQQALAQQQLNIPYQQFQTQQQYPFTIAQFLQSLVTGSQMGQSTSTTTPPAPSALGTAAGLGLSGLGLYQYLNQPSTTTTGSGGGLGGGLLSAGLGLLGNVLGIKNGGVASYARGGYASGGPPWMKHQPNNNNPASIEQALQQLFSGESNPNTDQLLAWLQQFIAQRSGQLPAPTPAPQPAPQPAPTQAPAQTTNTMPSLFQSGTGVPQLNAAAFAPTWAYPTAPTGTGYQTGQQTYINALPSISPSSMPAPYVYQMPSSVTSALSSFAQNAGGTGNGIGKYRGGLIHKDDGGATGSAQPLKLPTPALPRGLGLLDVGLGILGANSPYAGTMIGQGAQKGLESAMAQRQQLDEGAQVINDGKTYSILYPSTGEVIKTGIPVTANWQLSWDQRSGAPILTNPATGETRAASIAGLDQYGNPVDPSTAGPGAPSASGVNPDSVSQIFDVNGQPLDPSTLNQSTQKQVGIGPTYDTLPPQGQQLVKMMVAGQVPIPQGRAFNAIPQGAGASWSRLVEAADEYDRKTGGSGFNTYTASNRAAVFKEFTSGGAQAPAAQITSANKVIGHLNDLWGDVDNLGNISGDQLNQKLGPLGDALNKMGLSGPTTTVMNQLNQWQHANSGDPQSQAIAQYVRDRLAVSEEITKFFASGGAGGGESIIQQNLNAIDMRAAPSVQKAAIQASVRLMAAQLQALQQRWQNGVGNPNIPPPGGSIISPDSQQVVSNISGWTPDQAAPVAGGSAPAAPAAAATGANNDPLGIR